MYGHFRGMFHLSEVQEMVMFIGGINEFVCEKEIPSIDYNFSL